MFIPDSRVYLFYLVSYSSNVGSAFFLFNVLCSSDGLNIFPSLCIQNGFDVFSFFTNALGALFLLCNKLLSPLYFDLNLKCFEMNGFLALSFYTKS